MKALLLLMMSLLVISCSTDQDPLSGTQSSIEKDSVPEKTQPEKEPAPSRDTLRLLVQPAIPQFTVGKPTTVRLIADSIGTKDQVEIEILNPPSPGEGEWSGLNPATGEFTWTPTAAFFKREGLRDTGLLEVRISTVSGVIVSRLESIRFDVFREANRPEILKVSKIFTESSVQEAQSAGFRFKAYKYEVDVRDTDSTGQVAGGPTLKVVRPWNIDEVFEGKDASPFTVVEGEPRRLDIAKRPDVWTYTVSVKPEDQELTHKKEEFTFGLVAVSRFGLESAEGNIPSQPKLVNFDMITAVPRPQTTWRRPFKAKVGVKTILQFSVTPVDRSAGQASSSGRNSKFDGKITAVDFVEGRNCVSPRPSFDGEDKCICKSSSSGIFNCSIELTPEASDTGKEFKVIYKATNTNPSLASDTAEIEFKSVFKVVK